MKYFLRKTLILVLTVFLISVLTFIAFHIIPGDPAGLILGTNATEEQLEALREQLGTNRPLSEQYTSWVSGFVRGDFGTSIRYRMPVSQLLKGRLPVTLALGLISLIIILLLGIPLGILAARKRGTWVERIIHFLTILGISVPNFFLCILETAFCYKVFQGSSIMKGNLEESDQIRKPIPAFTITGLLPSRRRAAGISPPMKPAPCRRTPRRRLTRPRKAWSARDTRPSR